MRTKIYLFSVFAFVTLAIAAPRTWVLKTGETVTCDYVSSGTTTLVVKTHGTNYFIKLSDLSTNDQAYVAEIKVRTTMDRPSSGDFMYLSSILVVWTNAASVFQAAKTLLSRENSPTPLDVSKAKDLLIEVARAGYVPAEIMLGDSTAVREINENPEAATFYPGGPGGLAYDEAASWYQMAAERGSADAQCKLAHMFQFNLGNWFYHGHFPITNEPIAYYDSPHIAETAKWYGAAAGQGDRRGKIGMAELYSLGSGVPQNVPEAMRLFEECECFLQMADLLRMVNGDHAEIYKWWRIGKIRGCNYLPHIGFEPSINAFSQEEMKDGERRATDYLLKRYGTTKPVTNNR
jgi:TPR repeat protein